MNPFVAPASPNCQVKEFALPWISAWKGRGVPATALVYGARIATDSAPVMPAAQYSSQPTSAAAPFVRGSPSTSAAMPSAKALDPKSRQGELDSRWGFSAPAKSGALVRMLNPPEAGAGVMQQVL